MSHILSCLNLNILDIIAISIGQISILLHYSALQISTLPPTHNPSLYSQLFPLLITLPPTHNSSPYSQLFPLLTTLPPTHNPSPYLQPFNQLHNIFHQVYCLSLPPQLPILTFITLQDLQSSAPKPAD